MSVVAKGTDQILKGNLMIACYLDDSSDLKRERALCAAGFLQRTRDWLDFNHKWNQQLKRFGIAYFKASECISLTGEFAKFRANAKLISSDDRKTASEIRSLLIDTIIEAHLEGVAVSILLADFWELQKEDARARKIFSSDPMFIAYQGVMFESAKRMAVTFPTERVAFVCDSQDRAAFAEACYRAFTEKNPMTARFMGSIDHADDKAIPALQAADLLASEARLQIEAWRRNEEEFSGMKKLKDSGSIQFAAYWDKAYMASVLDASDPSSRH